MWSRSLLFLLTALTLTSCYRAPTDDDYCTTPATNNPSVTRHSGSFQPGISY